MAKAAPAPATSPSTINRSYDDWDAKDAMQTLQRADDIQNNPPLHRAAKRHARKQIRALKRIASAKPASAAKSSSAGK